MELPPKPSEFSPYEQFAITLLTQVDELLTARNTPQVPEHRGPRSRKLELTKEEIAAVAPIFMGHVLDAPDTMSLWLASDYPVPGWNTRLACQEILFIATTHEDVKTDYCVWIEPGSDPLVSFDKEAVRITPSPEPYAVGPVSCEAEYHEQLSRKAPVEEHERAALQEVVDALFLPAQT